MDPRSNLCLRFFQVTPVAQDFSFSAYSKAFATFLNYKHKDTTKFDKKGWAIVPSANP